MSTKYFHWSFEPKRTCDRAESGGTGGVALLLKYTIYVLRPVVHLRCSDSGTNLIGGFFVMFYRKRKERDDDIQVLRDI